MNEHVKIHSDEKPFDCFLCDKKFSELIFVRVHSDKKPFGCYSCEKKFLQTPNFKYNDHVRIHWECQNLHRSKTIWLLFIGQEIFLNSSVKTLIWKTIFCYSCDKKFLQTPKSKYTDMKNHLAAPSLTRNLQNSHIWMNM